jgi:hypothetical protein
MTDASVMEERRWGKGTMGRRVANVYLLRAAGPQSDA